MVRLLFVVNEHPNEAFAISCALRTIEELEGNGFKAYFYGKDNIPEKPVGNEVIFAKMKPEESNIGIVLKQPLKRERSLFDMQRTDSLIVSNRKFLVKETRPFLSYFFHCTSFDNRCWSKRGGRNDFTIVGASPEQRTVEIKSYYIKYPKTIARKFEAGLEPTVFEHNREQHHCYFEKTTSYEQSRAAGLAPEAFGKALAEKIMQEVKLQQEGRALLPLVGEVPRVFGPKPKRTRPGFLARYRRPKIKRKP